MALMLREQLKQQLEEAKHALGASSCTFYLSDPRWPGGYRLAAMAGVRYEEPMFGFVYTDTARHILAGGEEEVFVSLPSEGTRRRATSILTDEIPEENRRMFGDFRKRENVKSFARLTKDGDCCDREAVLFVNYDFEVTFDEGHKAAIRSLFAKLLTDVHSLQQELTDADAEWRSEATRIVSPIQTIAHMNFYTIEKPDLFFSQVIDAALRVLDVPEGKGLGVIHLYNRELEMLELRGSFGPIEYLERAQRHSVKNGDGVVSWVALTRRALLIQDLAESEFKRIHVSINDNSKCELAVPLEAAGELIGTMCLECTEAKKFKPHHARSVWYAANKAAVAYQLHQLASMNRKLLQLCWQATAIEGGAPVSLSDVAALARDFLKASSCDISRYNSDTGRFDTGQASYAGFEPQIRVDGWTDFIRRSNSPIWIGDIENATQYSIHQWEQSEWKNNAQPNDHPKSLNKAAVEGGVRSALGIPITVHEQCIGVAWLKYKRERLECPKPGLMSFALGFAAEAGLVLDSIQRQEIDLRERREIDSVGDQIVTAISERWELGNSTILDAHVSSYPFHWRLGGDLYAGKKIDTKTAGILLLDGQGHGVAGSLHMLPLMTAFESFCQSYSPAHVISQLAKTAEILGVRGSAIYSVFTRIDDKRWLSVASAGHESLIIFKKEQRSRWSFQYFPDSQTPMLGLPLKEPFIDYRIPLSAGDVVVGYTDGVAEQHESFDATHLATFVAELLGDETASAETIAEAIIEKSKERHSYALDDDATVFVARVK